MNQNHEIFSEPFGPFTSFFGAEVFADTQINEIRIELSNAFGLTGEEIDEHFEFDYTIKKVFSEN